MSISLAPGDENIFVSGACDATAKVSTHSAQDVYT